MKILAILVNVVLLAFIITGILVEGVPGKSWHAYALILLLLVTVLNTVILSGSNIDFKWLSEFLKKSIRQRQSGLLKGLSFFNISKTVTIILNLSLIVVLYLLYRSSPEPSPRMIFHLLLLFMLFTPAFSLVVIAAGRSNKFADIKRTLIISASGLVLLFSAFFLSMYIWIGHDVKDNIKLASEKYPGKAEDALLEYLRDENNSLRDRSSVAIWTLGQIRSEKALPVLYSYYKNDPEGLTCKGRHKYVLCQYELHKAINKIETRKYRWFSFARLNR